MTHADAVAHGFCLVAIRSTTGIGFDSSTSGGSFTGKNTSRRLPHKEANTPSSCCMMSPSPSEDSTPARNTGAGLFGSSFGINPYSDKLVRLNGRARPQPLCLPSRIARASSSSFQIPVCCRFCSLPRAAPGPTQHSTKVSPAPRAPLSLTHIGPRKSLSKLLPASPSFGALPDTIELCPEMNSPARTTLQAQPGAQPVVTRTTRNECPKHPTPSQSRSNPR